MLRVDDALPPEATRQEELDQRIESLLAEIPEEKGARDVVRRACELAERLHQGQRRASGAPYIEHPLEVARILQGLNMDPASIAAGFLHDLLEDTDLTVAELREEFPEPIPQLVEGVTKIGRIHFDTSREHQIENLRKIILAMARDIRVIIIKLSDRLHNMRTLDHLSEERQHRISRETLDIYAPLANRLGMVRVKTELEDLAMRWLYPREYRELQRQVAIKRAEREAQVQKAMDFLRNYLAELGHNDIEIHGRTKHFYSIFRKMRTQGLTFDEIYDLNAVRIICSSEAKCYEIMGQIHAIWQPLPGRIKDYIGMPKPNMYQSLHTTVIGFDGVVTEIQIRTQEMHSVAEYGIAAHWRYKEGKVSQEVDKRLGWLRQLTEWITEVTEPDTLLDALKRDVFADVVLCFTPRGDVIELPAGANPIDFAYAIHTEVGERCVGARVNRRMVSLRTRLNHGDVVEILTNPNGHPSRDWLDVVVTGRARSKIKHWLKSKEMEKWVADGRAALNRLLKERNLDVTRTELDENLEKLLAPFRLQTIEDVLAEIGFGSISAQAALTRMNPEWSRPRRPRRVPKKPAEKKHGSILVDGMEGMQIRLAHCCNPIPGDRIVGFITRGRGVTVHQARCPNITHLRRVNGESGRIVEAHWNTTRPEGTSHNVSLRIEAEDRSGLLAELSRVITKEHIFIAGCQTRSQRSRASAILRFDLEVRDVDQLEELIVELRQIPGVVRVDRLGRASPQ